MRSVFVALTAGAILAGGCATDSVSDGADDDEQSSPDSTVAAASAGSFGNLGEVCGEGEATLDPDEAGIGTDKLYVGVTTDRTSDIRPGLNQELYDSSAAFVNWCNQQGGISGLEIELLDIDGKLIDVEGAMATACTDAFALVGGGLAQDNLMLSGKAESDFEMCGLISIPAWTVSPQFAEAEGVITPIPNPSDKRSHAFFEVLQQERPEVLESYVSVYGDLASIKSTSDASDATLKGMGGVEVLDPIVYDPLGTQDWGITAEQIRSSGATFAMYFGEPTNLSFLAKKLQEQDWAGTLASETNTYDQIVIDSSGPDAVEGFMVRTAIKPFEEADEWPEIAQYLEILEQIPNTKRASLGVQGFSAWLLFADSINACASEGDGLVTRACVMESAETNTAWDGGGLHAAADLSTDSPPACAAALEIIGGEFVRAFPEIGSPDDDGNGMYCTDPAYIDIEI